MIWLRNLRNDLVNRILRVCFRLTPPRFRCRLFGHIAKVTEWPAGGRWGGTYEMTDPSECGRCGKRFPPPHPAAAAPERRSGAPQRREERSAGSRLEGSKDEDDFERQFAEAFNRTGAYPDGVNIEAIRDWYRNPADIGPSRRREDAAPQDEDRQSATGWREKETPHPEEGAPAPVSKDEAKGKAT